MFEVGKGREEASSDGERRGGAAEEEHGEVEREKGLFLGPTHTAEEEQGKIC